MPTLNWIGKEKVINHHLDVPFRTLKSEYAFGDVDSAKDNLIIHGDNLEALKALLPRYEGKVKVVCIDPPYNTGNESWVYNDNVNDPKIKKWLGQVVGKEGEDLSRHDKWLCMMYPRLKLLHRLLRDDGVIFISIDDNEVANLRLICNDIFGSRNFVSNIIWQKTYSPRNDSGGIPYETDNILVFSKTQNWTPLQLERTDEMNTIYKTPDNDSVPWTSGDACAPDSIQHQGMVYAIQHPFTGAMMYPPTGSHWRMGQSEILEIMKEWAAYDIKDLHDEEERARICDLDKAKIRQGVLGIILNEPLETARDKAQRRLKDGKWPLLYFTANGNGGIRRKRYLDPSQGRKTTNHWPYSEVGHTDEAKKEIKLIFNGQSPFQTPKPSRLINRILQIASDPDSIILDSFAGSGTTAHAVLKLNQADGGNRRFILIEMEDYARTITAERVRRVISGYGSEDKKVPGTGGGFSFLSLGPAVFTADGKLNPDVEDEALREYLWYAETKTALPEAKKKHPHCLGSCRGISYYFFYKKGEETTLDYAFLKTITEKDDQYVIYADACSLDGEYLKSRGIQFKKIPRDIPRY